ncbi:MAG: hypothetical protein HQL51_05410 [Magnetococcales bacterium]|nr:hypothetical protein [Magnetococcales bacterium]
MNARQREMLSKTLADVGKGLLLAAAVGSLAEKAAPFPLVTYFFTAVYFLIAAYLLEGKEL